jgi:hypothetical protein
MAGSWLFNTTVSGTGIIYYNIEWSISIPGLEDMWPLYSLFSKFYALFKKPEVLKNATLHTYVD